MLAILALNETCFVDGLPCRTEIKNTLIWNLKSSQLKGDLLSLRTKTMWPVEMSMLVRTGSSHLIRKTK